MQKDRHATQWNRWDVLNSATNSLDKLYQSVNRHSDVLAEMNAEIGDHEVTIQTLRSQRDAVVAQLQAASSQIAGIHEALQRYLVDPTDATFQMLLTALPEVARAKFIPSPLDEAEEPEPAAVAANEVNR